MLPNGYGAMSQEGVELERDGCRFMVEMELAKGSEGLLVRFHVLLHMKMDVANR